MNTKLNLDIKQYDVATVFLNSPIDGLVIMKLPNDWLGFLRIASNQFWFLKKTVYGLKQWNREWVDMVSFFNFQHYLFIKVYTELIHCLYGMLYFTKNLSQK